MLLWGLACWQHWIFWSGWTSHIDHITSLFGTLSMCPPHTQPMSTPIPESHACHFPSPVAELHVLYFSPPLFFSAPSSLLLTSKCRMRRWEEGKASPPYTPPAHLPHTYIPKAQPRFYWLVILLTYNLLNFWDNSSLLENGETYTILHQDIGALWGSDHAP